MAPGFVYAPKNTLTENVGSKVGYLKEWYNYSDPASKNASTHFFQVCSNPGGTKYFDDYDEDIFSTDQESLFGIHFWDKASGECVNDGEKVQEKLRELFPRSIRKSKISCFISARVVC